MSIDNDCEVGILALMSLLGVQRRHRPAIILAGLLGAALPVWQEKIFAAMVRNASHVIDYFRLPSEQVVEIGREISI